jgi:parallel beta-helix repeat protein
VYDNWLTDISDNAIRLCDNEAVSVYSNEIEGCAIGIADVQDVGTIVESNIMEACQDGIQVRGSEDSFLALNVISSSAHYGISIALSKLIAVQENTISNSASYGLWVNTSQYVEVSLNRFVDNNGPAAPTIPPMPRPTMTAGSIPTSSVRRSRSTSPGTARSGLWLSLHLLGGLG